MVLEAVYHRIDSEYCYAVERGKLLIKIRCKKNDFDTVKLHCYDKYMFSRKAAEKITVKMEKRYSDTMFDYFEAEADNSFKSLFYYFRLENSKTVIYYGNLGFYEIEPDKSKQFFLIPYTHEADMVNIPDWTKDSIVYQIFPDRFHPGEENFGEEWYKTIENHREIHGGKLRGITQKLDYIKELGVDTIYMTPIFKAGSSHKYDTHDYYEIDSDFGTKEEFRELVGKAHEKGVKIILDCVFNHCGVEFFAFKDLLQNQENSKYLDWFNVKEFPVEVRDFPPYESFGYYKVMPKLMLDNPEVRGYFIEVAKYWIREFDIDGWRLDVGNEISHDFWREFRKEVKKLKQDLFIVGEIWHESSPWLNNGEQYDSVMNYIFAGNIWDFIGSKTIDAEQFSENMGRVMALYKRPILYSLWNMIGSHDTSRFLTTAEGKIDRLKLAVLIQMTFIGIPVIYYGDETGMEGGGDPYCRQPMLWESKQNNDIREYYKKAAELRRDNIVFRRGDIKMVYADKNSNLLIYERVYGDEKATVIINSGEKEFLIEESHNKKILFGKEFIRVNSDGNFILEQGKGAVLGF